MQRTTCFCIYTYIYLYTTITITTNINNNKTHWDSVPFGWACEKRLWSKKKKAFAKGLNFVILVWRVQYIWWLHCFFGDFRIKFEGLVNVSCYSKLNSWGFVLHSQKFLNLNPFNKKIICLVLLLAQCALDLLHSRMVRSCTLSCCWMTGRLHAHSALSFFYFSNTFQLVGWKPSLLAWNKHSAYNLPLEHVPTEENCMFLHVYLHQYEGDILLYCPSEDRCSSPGSANN